MPRSVEGELSRSNDSGVSAHNLPSESFLLCRFRSIPPRFAVNGGKRVDSGDRANWNGTFVCPRWRGYLYTPIVSNFYPGRTDFSRSRSSDVSTDSPDRYMLYCSWKYFDISVERVKYVLRVKLTGKSESSDQPRVYFFFLFPFFLSILSHVVL